MDPSPRRLSPHQPAQALRSPTLLWAAFAALLLGVLGGLGVLFPASGLSQPLATLPGVTLAGSLGIFGLGLALLGHATGRRRLFQVASFATAFFGAAALMARAILASTAVGPTTPAAGSILRQLPATTGILLLLGGLGLFVLTLQRRRRLAHIVAGVCGSTVLLVSLTVVIGRLSGFLGGTNGSLITGASVYELLVGGINGVALMRVAAGFDAPAPRVVTWLPNVIGVVAALTVIVIWIALVGREDALIQQQIGLASQLANSNVLAELKRIAHWSDRTAASLAVRSPAVHAVTVERLRPLSTDETQAVVAAAWARPDASGDGRSVIVVSAEPRYSAILRRAVEREVRAPVRVSSDSSGRFDFFAVPEERHLFVLGVRDCADKPCRAPFAVVVDARRAFRSLLTDSLTGFFLAVRLANQRVISSGLSSQTDDKWLRSSKVDLAAGGDQWEITVWPTPATLARAHSDLPEGVLVLGLALAMLVPFTLRLADSTWSAAARTERARVNTALESATDSLWTWDIASATIERSAALWSRLGFPVPTVAVPISAWVALVHPSDENRVRQVMSRHVTGDSESLELEYRVRAADDQWHWLVERGRVVERSADGAALRVFGVTADITERKNAVEALAASERKYRATFDNASQLKALLGEGGRIAEMNSAGRLLSGGSEVRVGLPIWEFPAFRGSRAARAALMEACESGYAGKATTCLVQLETDEVDSPTWDISVAPIADREGTVTQLLLNARDITDRKRAEQALRELGNLATMGRLTALVAHEINNPLAGIQSAFSLIKGAIAEAHPYHRYVGAIEREIDRIAKVTKQLYETYRHEPESSHGASISTVVGDAVAFMEQVNRRSAVRILIDLTTAPSVVPYPDALIRRVVYNLVQNAVDASPPNGEVHLTASNGDGVFTLTVRDEGSGISPEVRGRIFDPFVSTKGSGMRTGGMGLGLALVHGSVTAFGGTVSVQDAAGGGSVFVVRLPLTHTIDGVRNGSGTHTAG